MLSMYRKNKPREEDTREVSDVAETKVKKDAVAVLRLQKEFTQLSTTDGITLEIPDKSKLTHFFCTIKPETGYWANGIFKFEFKIPDEYPFEKGPDVTCNDKIWHPNIDLNGRVCVSTLRPWKSTTTIEQVILSLLYILLLPNGNSPLNEQAGKELREDPELFKRNVLCAMKGEKVNEIEFPKNPGITKGAEALSTLKKSF